MRPGPGRPMPGRPPAPGPGPARGPYGAPRPYGAPNPYARRPARSSSKGRERALLALLLAITLGAGVWYFLFRGPGAPNSDFALAEQRYVQAVQEIETATGEVTFARGDPDYEVTYQDARARMQIQLAVFQQLATSEEGEASDVATGAARSARLGISSAEALNRALYRTNISDADRAREQLADAVSEIHQQGRAWQQL